MDVCYISWLHMHQPMVWLDSGKIVSNIEKMLSFGEGNEKWDAMLMLRAYKNPAKYVSFLAEGGFKPRINLDFSGILLESLQDLDRRKLTKKIIVDGEAIGPIIPLYKKVLKEFPSCIEFAGTAYSHCYFPATPEEDWQMQIKQWRKTFKEIFGSSALEKVKGFWLPEMGVPGKEELVGELIRCVKENYEWMILPIQSIQGYERLTYDERIRLVCQPHILKASEEDIPVVFRVPTYLIDQQAGCDANLLYEKSLEAKKIFSSASGKPALIITASDGENGNVMMNEFFPNAFVPFFKKKSDEKVSSLTVSEFLDKFYKREGKFAMKSEIRLKDIGGSWIGGHEQWVLGPRKVEMIQKIISLSKRFHELKDAASSGELKKSKKDLEEIEKLLLVTETSCYTYWGVDYWFDQGLKFVNLCERKIDEFEKYI